MIGAGDEAGSVTLVDLHKRFGDAVAVENLNLEIPAGSFFALLGPSGCGKTTTLRMVAGLEVPTSGQVLIGDEEITFIKPYKRPVNTVFQSYALFPHLDIFENVAFGLRRTGVSKAEIAKRVGEVLELVQLTRFERRKPVQLSGGQQQRVALARALVNHPKVLLLDEPLGALDLKLRKQMQIELKRIQTEVGITFVHVTHDQEEAMTMADTIAVMHDGRMEQLGTPVDLYERPMTEFVAGFLGQSNLLSGTWERGDEEHAVLRVGSDAVRVPAALVGSASGSGRVGVRPEKIALSPAGNAATNGRNTLTATITDASFTGVSTQYLVRTPSGDELTVYAQNLAVVELRPGDPVALSWDPLHTFVVT